jgi:hypothetical protein
MTDSNPLTSSRPTLKLKVAARKPREENFSVSPGHSGSYSRPATASQAREPYSPHEISGATPSPSLPHPVANTAPPRSQSKLIKKPGAALSDELKRRMQEDMDALLTR